MTPVTLSPPPAYMLCLCRSNCGVAVWPGPAKEIGSVCLLLQYLLQSCSHCQRGGGAVEDMCYERLRAETCVD